MQLHKYYGRTIGGALAQVKRDLGAEALILETNALEAGNAAARMNPGARYEVLAARDPRGGVEAGPPSVRPLRPGPPDGRTRAEALKSKLIQTYGETHDDPPPDRPLRPGPPPIQPQEARAPRPHNPWPANDQSGGRDARAPGKTPARTSRVLRELGLLRSQITQLLEGAGEAEPARIAGETAGTLDIRDYHTLIEQGIDHRVLAPHFRAWLEWRTASERIRRYLSQMNGGPALAMQGESLREWLWLAWSEEQNLPLEQPAEPLRRGPRLVGLIGPTGGGKTTTLAKMASIIRQSNRQKAVIVTLDALRFAATEQWRRIAKLMDIPLLEVVSLTDLSVWMENWGQLDWIGIDTPGGMTLESEAGRWYGSILAQWPQMESVMVLPATQQESISREQMQRGRLLKADRILFSKLDETNLRGGIVNLTMDGKWKIDGFATGPRVPQDWEAASRDALWRRVLAPASVEASEGAVC